MCIRDRLNTVQSTDRGVKASAEQRQIVDGLVARLERSYEGTVAADSPEWLYRECEVAYVGQRSSRKANAAGGRFRGRVGRLLFRTTAMYQHVLYHSTGNLAINFIKFRLLGLLPGSVVLRGAVEPEADREALGALQSCPAVVARPLDHCERIEIHVKELLLRPLADHFDEPLPIFER